MNLYNKAARRDLDNLTSDNKLGIWSDGLQRRKPVLLNYNR